jgi:cysteine desulfurase / selenocysteine lyase
MQKTALETSDLHSVYDEFSIKKNGVAYFNNASYTPMSNSTIGAITEAMEKYSGYGPDDQNYLQLKAGGDLAKEKLSLLLNAPKEGFVLTESATQSINLVANGFRFKPGDSLVIRGGPTEHPSNYLPWKYYAERKALRLIDLAIDNLGYPDLSELDSNLRRNRPKLVVMSHVLYNLGTVMPAKEVARISHERGALFFLDASQSVANIETDLSFIDCDFAAGTAAKWLCGPLGLGFIFCKKEALEILEPLNFGPNACVYGPDGSFKPLETSWRLQEGFRNWAYSYGLATAIDLISSFSVARAREKSLKLADMLIETVDSRAGKYHYLGARDRDLRTNIVPIDSTAEKSAEVVQRLRKSNVTIAEREIGAKKMLRISPHFYNDEKEMSKVCELL